MDGTRGDFEDFVTARWRELHAVALVTTGDHATGTTAAVAGLASLAARWPDVLATGSPTRQVREAVLAHALRTGRAPGMRPTRRPAAPPPDAGASPVFGLATAPARADAGDDPADRATDAVLASADPLARAVLAVRVWWDDELDLLATVARTDRATLERAEHGLRDDVAAARAVALRRDPHDLGWGVDAAVLDALEAGVDHAPAADPLALVAAARSSSARRRRGLTVVAATAAVALVAGVAWLAPWGDTPGPGAPASESPVWADVSTWPARGPLVTDPAVVAIAAAHRGGGEHLLYAGRVGDTLAVVTGAGTANNATSTAPSPVRLFTAPARLGPAALAPLAADDQTSQSAPDVVALSVPQEDGSGAVLVLARPTVTSGLIRTASLPMPDGTVTPVLSPFGLDGGVGSPRTRVDAPMTTVDVGGFSGVPSGMVWSGFETRIDGSAEDLARGQRAYVARLTNLRVDQLGSRVLVDTALPASAVSPEMLGVPATDLRVQVTAVVTTTPDGGTVRTVRLDASAPGARSTYLLESGSTLRAGTEGEALLELPSDVLTFVAIAENGARVELVSPDGHVRDRARVVGGAALLRSTRNTSGSDLRLRVLDADGRVLSDRVPPVAVDVIG